MIPRFRILIFSALALLFASIANTAHAGHTKHALDASGGAPEAHTFTFVIVTQDDSDDKSVAVLIDNDKQKLNYVYQRADGAITLGLRPNFSVPGEEDDDHGCTIISVRLSDAQFENVRGIIQKYVNKPDQSDSPEIRFYNCASEILKTCSMRLPYRSPYRPPNLVQWVGDVPDYNKDLAVQK